MNNHKSVKDVLMVILVIVGAVTVLGLVGNILWFALKLLIPCAIIYALTCWIIERTAFRRYKKQMSMR